MSRNDLINEYFEWLSKLVCGIRYSRDVSYKKLLTRLHETDFHYLIPIDQNRAKDGVNLRYRFIISNDYNYEYVMDVLDRPCSVFEMMVALAVRCEETIMDDPAVGNRTGQWFWGMVTNMGLGSMTDDKFDRRYVDDVISRFLNREYEPDGRGGLFTIRGCPHDLRDVEIFNQLCWYLDNIT